MINSLPKVLSANFSVLPQSIPSVSLPNLFLGTNVLNFLLPKFLSIATVIAYFAILVETALLE